MDSDAVPPSSPPRATRDTRSESPFFEPEYNAYNTKSSSPPPLFSSDDSLESVDVANYESPRILKNKRKGAWWDNRDLNVAEGSPAPKKSKMTRNYDSGIYMLSDGTESSESLEAQHKSPFTSEASTDTSCDQDAGEDAQRIVSTTQEERDFDDKMYRGMDKNAQWYEFRAMNLQDHDIRHVGELASVIKNIPDPGDELPAEAQYRSMVPELHISFENNRLRHLTPALFDLRNVVSLNLRDNQIDELPQQIGNLRKLQELHITGNNIRWLPFDLLSIFAGDSDGSRIVLGATNLLTNPVEQVYDLFDWPMDRHSSDDPSLFRPRPGHDFGDSNLHAPYDPPVLDPDSRFNVYREIGLTYRPSKYLWLMKTLESTPNFYNSFKARVGVRPVFPHHANLGMSPDSRRRVPLYFSRTPVAYFHQSGALVTGSATPPTSQEDVSSVITETLRGSHGVPTEWFAPSNFNNEGRSLATMALHAALRYSSQEDLSIEDLRDQIGEMMPRPVDDMLRQAEANDAGGYGAFKKCHVCRSEYVTRRAEWIEWWGVKVYRVLPFKVQVCSWACVPSAMRRKPEKEFVFPNQTNPPPR